MSGVEIDEKHHVSRYCKPLSIEDGLPGAEAFELRNNEKYLSVNWLEYFSTPDLAQAIDCVRQAFRNKGYSVGIKGRFVSLKVCKLKEVISNHTDLSVRIVRIPEENDPSHCGVYGYTGHISMDKLIALKIAKLAHDGNVYLGKIS